MSKNGILHQLIAVEPDLTRAANSRRKEAIQTFKKAERFTSVFTKLAHFKDEDRYLDQETSRKLDTTVPEVLGYALIAAIRAVDATVQKESTNQLAKADLVVDGTVLAKDVPATALLAMESRVKDMKEMFLMIPTLAPGFNWQKDAMEAKDVYRAEQNEERFKTLKTQIPVVLYEATENHPANVILSTKDIPVGKYTDTRFSGMMTPIDKANILDRLEKVERGLKAARNAANTQVTDKREIAKEIMTYICGEDMTLKSPA